jgi:hypothetical protein
MSDNPDCEIAQLILDGHFSEAAMFIATDREISQLILNECKLWGVTPLVLIAKNQATPQALRWLWKPSFPVNAASEKPATPRQLIEFLRIGRAIVGNMANKWTPMAVGQYRWWTVRLLD